MKTYFTPGPWRATGGIRNPELFMWIFAKDPSPGANRELQVFSMKDSHPIKEHLIRRQADMDLIAAAPEMFEQLAKIVEPSAGTLLSFDQIKDIRKLLKKITKKRKPLPNKNITFKTAQQ